MNKHCDAIVVGSGAAGSFAAKELTERGLNIMVLEAGRLLTADDFKINVAGPKEKGMQLWARAQAAVTGQPIQSKVAMYAKQQRHLFVKDGEHPYSTPKEAPFLWIRGKQLGGRLHTYGRMLLRWSDYDFKAASRDGQGADWPISYADLAPYYSRAENFLGVYGRREGIENLPDGEFVGPSRLTEVEQQFKEAIEQAWPNRHATSWRYMPPRISHIPKALLAAQQTGKLTIRADAVVRRVLTDDTTGRSTGVEFVDRAANTVEQVHADIVMLCASAIETVRLMLNSVSAKHPRGLGNSSGVLGRYFMDQVPSLIMGTVPGKTGCESDGTVEPDPFYGVTGGVYIPRYENLDHRTSTQFARGFAFQGTVGRLYTRSDRPAKFALMGFGEMLPRADNTITLHPSRKDAWGMPIPHIICRTSDNEQALLGAQMQGIYEMVRAAGLQVEFNGSSLRLDEYGAGAFPDADPVSRWLFRQHFKGSMSMGAAIHESGGARMGADPSNSVLNSNNQCWDAPNVFVTDASCFASGGCAGTTLTLMALTIRASEFIAENRGTL
jgi:choline dehydrogenase-like flavoprotein